MPAAIPYIALAVTVAGTAASVYSSNKQAKAQRAAADAQQKAQDTSVAESKNEQLEQLRQQNRDRRMRVAQIENAASNQGTGGSSGAIGAVNNINTNSAISQSNTFGANKASDGISSWNRVANGYMNEASRWGTIGSIANATTSLGSAGMGFYNQMYAGGSSKPDVKV